MISGKLSADDPQQPSVCAVNSVKMFSRAGTKLIIVILLSIAVVIGARTISGSVSRERTPTVREDVDSLAAVIDLYHDREGSYPVVLAGLVERRYLERLPMDFWGVPYNYSIDQPRVASDDQPFYVWTLGSDNRVGGDGPDRDVGNW